MRLSIRTPLPSDPPRTQHRLHSFADRLPKDYHTLRYVQNSRGLSNVRNQAPILTTRRRSTDHPLHVTLWFLILFCMMYYNTTSTESAHLFSRLYRSPFNILSLVQPLRVVETITRLLSISTNIVRIHTCRHIALVLLLPPALCLIRHGS